MKKSMSLMFKKMLNGTDLLFGYTMYFLIGICIFAFSLAFCALGLFYFAYMPFEGDFSFNELDNLELLGFLIFIFVTVRFLVRSQSKGESFWAIFTTYVFLLSVTTAFCFAVSCVLLVVFVLKHGQFGISDFQHDVYYFAFFIVHLVVIYALTPLPELNWFSKDSKEDNAPVEKQDAEPVSADSTEEKADSTEEKADSTEEKADSTEEKADFSQTVREIHVLIP
jgi:magnesium-transporting ATPase (P-type)